MIPIFWPETHIMTIYVYFSKTFLDKSIVSFDSSKLFLLFTCIWQCVVQKWMIFTRKYFSGSFFTLGSSSKTTIEKMKKLPGSIEVQQQFWEISHNSINKDQNLCLWKHIVKTQCMPSTFSFHTILYAKWYKTIKKCGKLYCRTE